MKLSRRTLLSTPLAVVAPVGELPVTDAKWLSIKCVAAPLVRTDAYQAPSEIMINGKVFPVESVSVTHDSSVIDVGKLMDLDDGISFGSDGEQ